MSYMELIEALRKEGEEKTHSIRQEAEAEAERIRGDASDRINRMRENCIAMQSREVNEQNEAVLSEADKQARRILLSAEKELMERLYIAAIHSLALLREKRYPDVFDALVRELPPREWRIVRVSPHDEIRARDYFPDSEIIADRNITAGLDVSVKEGGMRVINTFEKRLENIWMEILPEVMRDVYGKIPEFGITDKD